MSKSRIFQFTCSEHEEFIEQQYFSLKIKDLIKMFWKSAMVLQSIAFYGRCCKTEDNHAVLYSKIEAFSK